MQCPFLEGSLRKKNNICHIRQKTKLLSFPIVGKGNQFNEDFSQNGAN